MRAFSRAVFSNRDCTAIFRISGHRAFFYGRRNATPIASTQHVCSVHNEYVCTKHAEKRPRTTSWRGRISGVGFAAKLERSNSIDRAWASLANRSARQTWGLFASARASVSCSVIAARPRFESPLPNLYGPPCAATASNSSCSESCSVSASRNWGSSSTMRILRVFGINSDPTATRTHGHFACRHQVDKRYHIRDDIFPSLLVAPALVRLDDQSEISWSFSAILFRSRFTKLFGASGLLLNSVAYVVARFSFPPILQLSAGKSRTSQMPKPVLAREESRLC